MTQLRQLSIGHLGKATATVGITLKGRIRHVTKGKGTRGKESLTLTFWESHKDPFSDDDTLYRTLGAVGITMKLLLAGNVGVDRERKLPEVT